jgi:hypothetical protein
MLLNSEPTNLLWNELVLFPSSQIHMHANIYSALMILIKFQGSNEAADSARWTL